MGLFAALYGGVAYAIFLATFLYAIGFAGNVIVPKSIDIGMPWGSAGEPLWTSLLVDALRTDRHAAAALVQAMMPAVVPVFCWLAVATAEALRICAQTCAESFGRVFDDQWFALIEDAAGALLGLWQAIRVYAQSRNGKSSSMVPP